MKDSNITEKKRTKSELFAHYLRFSKVAYIAFVHETLHLLKYIIDPDWMQSNLFKYLIVAKILEKLYLI